MGRAGAIFFLKKIRKQKVDFERSVVCCLLYVFFLYFPED